MGWPANCGVIWIWREALRTRAHEPRRNQSASPIEKGARLRVIGSEARASDAEELVRRDPGGGRRSAVQSCRNASRVGGPGGEVPSRFNSVRATFGRCPHECDNVV